jgi:predicted metal-dependent RNase
MEHRSGKNPFYGSTNVKKVVEDIIIRDFDKRKDIAPCGIRTTITIGTNKVLDIKISKHYLDHEGEGKYLAIFSIEEKVYEFFIKFDKQNRLDFMTLSEWLSSGDFEDGEDADNIYHTEDFTSFDKWEC